MHYRSKCSKVAMFVCCRYVSTSYAVHVCCVCVGIWYAVQMCNVCFYVLCSARLRCMCPHIMKFIICRLILFIIKILHSPCTVHSTRALQLSTYYEDRTVYILYVSTYYEVHVCCVQCTESVESFLQK